MCIFRKLTLDLYKLWITEKYCAQALPFATPNSPPLVSYMDSTSRLPCPRALSWAQGVGRGSWPSENEVLVFTALGPLLLGCCVLSICLFGSLSSNDHGTRKGK